MKTVTLALILASFAGPATAATPQVEDIEFQSRGVTLSGSIAWPADQPVRAAVVFIHGSGKQSRNLDLAKRFAEHGIAALVYDKRGAGQSGGVYESNQSVSGPNIELLADDAAAAFDALAGKPALGAAPIGFTGISQAGWIAPLAAVKRPQAGFLVLWSGPVSKVSEEDIYSKYTPDADMAAPPPYAEALKARKDPYIWPDFLGRDTDSGEDLARLEIPGLWVFSDNDGSIPVDLSITRLQALKGAGHRYDYLLLPRLGHNNIETTFAQVVEWIRKLPR